MTTPTTVTKFGLMISLPREKALREMLRGSKQEVVISVGTRRRVYTLTEFLNLVLPEKRGVTKYGL